MSVMRVFLGNVREGYESAKVEDDLFSWLEAGQPGLMAYYQGRSFNDPSELAVITVWDSVESCKTAMGEDLNEPKWFNEDHAAMFSDYSLDHYAPVTEVAAALDEELATEQPVEAPAAAPAAEAPAAAAPETA